MKKTIILLTSLLLPIMASAYDAYIDGIYYNFNRTYKTAAVTFYSVSEENQKTYSGKVNIPTSIVYGGITYEVTQIGEWAFYNCSDLTSITIPNSVTSIRTNAFRGCSGLTSVTIPNSVITIEFGAFNETGWYNNQLDGILYLDNWVIGYKGEKTKGELVIADGTKGIANSAFSSCSGLTSVTMPNSVTTIGSGVFSGCTALADVTISSAVTSIGNWAFQGCSSLSSITIPNSVTDIGVWAFRGCSSLTSVAIPNSITSVVSGAFAECSGLTSVTMPNSITSIKKQCFLEMQQFDIYQDTK